MMMARWRGEATGGVVAHESRRLGLLQTRLVLMCVSVWAWGWLCGVWLLFAKGAVKIEEGSPLMNVIPLAQKPESQKASLTITTLSQHSSTQA